MVTRNRAHTNEPFHWWIWGLIWRCVQVLMPMTFLFEQLVRTGFSGLHIDEGIEFYTNNDLKISNQGPGPIHFEVGKSKNYMYFVFGHGWVEGLFGT